MMKLKMTGIFRTAAFAVVSACIYSAGAATEFSSGIHKCAIDKSREITLVKDGQGLAEIVIEKNCSPVVKFAAEELKRFLKDATGAELKIVNARNNAIPGIVIGETKLAKDAGLDVSKLPRDGFCIKSINNTIFITGKDDPSVNPEKFGTQWFERATLFGVYDFLERFAGIRFYFPGKEGTVVPAVKTLSIPSADIVEAPDFSNRSAYPGVDKSIAYYNQDANKVRNLNILRLRSQTKYLPNCHSLSRSGIVERFAEKKPEFFAILPNGKRDNDLSLPGHHGHLCYTNKDLENEIYEDAAAFLSGKPASYRGIKTKKGSTWDQSAFQPGYFNIMPQDGHGPSNFCRCPECWKYYGNDKAGELVWTFVSNIAERLKKNDIKGYVTAMAYGPYRGVPEHKIPDNVLVMLAVTGPWQDKAADIQSKFDQLIKDWDNKIAPRKVWLWNYAGKYGEKMIPGIPASTPRCIASFYKRNAPYITGAFLESETDFYIFNYLNYYVFFKVAWNNSTDVETLLKEHDELMFGPAAGLMGNFFSQIEELWTQHIIGKIYETPLGPRTVIPSETKIFTEIYSEKTVSEMKKLFEEAQKLTEGKPEYAARVNFIEKNFLDEIINARKRYFNKKREIEDLVFEILPAKEKDLQIDGKIDEAAWTNAPSVFMVPWNADKAAVKTKVSGLWDEKYLYLAIDCEEPETSKFSAVQRKNDDELIWQDASVEIFLNFSEDRKTYYQLIVNPFGSFSDQQLIIDNEDKKTWDWKWNSNAIVKTRIETNKGWTAEIKIPLSSFKDIKFADGSRFTVNFTRSRNLKNVSKEENQYYTWSPFLKVGFHDLERFGTLQFSQKKTEDGSIIKNGNFNELKKDGTPSDWSLPKDADARKKITIDKSVFIDGGQSLKIASDANDDLFVTQYLPDLKANTKYSLTFFIKTENIESSEKGGAFVNIWTDKNECFPTSYYQGSIPWGKQGFEFTTGADVNGKVRSYIRLRIRNASGSVWFDDVRLRENK